MSLFAIIHEIDGNQCLIDSSIQTDDSDFNIGIKFWSEPSNGFVTLTLGFEDNEDNFNEAFEKLKSIDCASEYVTNFNNSFK